VPLFVKRADSLRTAELQRWFEARLLVWADERKQRRNPN
jgi:hypothetical protein